MSRIRVGIVGLGFGQTVHIPGFRAVSNVDIVAIASKRYDVAKGVAKEYGVPLCFSSWQEMLSEPGIDAVSIATPPAIHSEIALASMAARKAVLCEKPLALNSTTAATMLAAARNSGLVHAINFEFREIPAWRFTKSLLEDGVARRIRHISVTWTISSWADPARTWSWRSNRACGGGVLGALGVHTLDYIQWLFGPVHAITAQLSTRIPFRPAEDGSSCAVTGEDCCNLLMLLKDGTPVAVTISNIAPSGRGHWLEIYGEHKTLILGSHSLIDYAEGFEVWVADRNSPPQKLSIPEEFKIKESFKDGRIGPFVQVARRFARSIQFGQDSMLPSFEDGYRAQLLVDCAFQSNESRWWVEVP